MTPLQHTVDVLLCLVVLAGPVPLALFLAAGGDPKRRRAPLAHAVLAGVTVWSVLQVALALGLGAIGRLARNELVLTEGAMLLVGLLVASGARPALRPAARRTEWSGADRALLATWSVVTLAMLRRVALTPVTESDSLSYHLPAMASWYQAHRFVTQSGLKGLAARFPYDWEALCALVLIPFGDDFLVTLPNVLAWLVLGLSSYLTSREVGARRADGLGAALILCTLPVTRDVLTTMHVEVAFAAFFMAGLYFALVRERLLLVAALGLVIGIKTTGPIYATLLLLTAAVIRRCGSPRSEPAPRTSPPSARHALAASIVSAAAVLAASFWYVRNVAEVGNPLGTVRLGIGSHTLFPGAIDATRLRQTTLLHQFHPLSGSDWRILLGILWNCGGLGLVLLGIAALAVCVHPPPGTRRDRFGLAALGIGTAILYAATPYSGGGHFTPWVAENFRYALPFLGVLSVLAALGSTVRRAPEAAVAAVVVGVVAARLGSVLVGGVLVAAVTAGAWFAFGRLTSPHTVRVRVPLAITAVAVIVLGGTLWLRRAHETACASRYGPISAFIATAIGRDETVGYVLSHWKYLFYGRDLGRRVIDVPAATGTREEWLAELQRSGIDVVAVGPLEPSSWQSRPERAWLEDPSGPFIRVFGRDPSREAVLYRRRPGREIESRGAPPSDNLAGQDGD